MRHPGAVYGHSKLRRRGQSPLFSSVSGRPGQKLWYRPVYSGGKWNQFLIGKTIGSLLQVCCGGSEIGTARIDIDPSAPGANILADMHQLPFKNKSFDTAACDPLYELSYPDRIKLQRELSRVARSRIIFKAPWIPRCAGWKLTETVLIGSHTCANVAVLSILDFMQKTKMLPGMKVERQERLLKEVES